MQKSSLIKQALYSWQPPIDNVTSTSPIVNTSERLFHPHHTSDLIPDFLARLTRQLQNLLKLSGFAGGQSPLDQSLSRSPTPTLSCSPTCPSRSFFSVLGNPYKTVTPSLALTTATTTYPPKFPKSQKPCIRRIYSDKLSRFSGNHCALSSGLLGL